MKTTIGITSRVLNSNQLYFEDPFQKYEIDQIELNLNYSFPPTVDHHFNNLLLHKNAKYSVHSLEVTLDGHDPFLDDFGRHSMQYSAFVGQKLKAQNVIYHWLNANNMTEPTPEFRQAIRKANKNNTFTLENNVLRSPLDDFGSLTKFAQKNKLKICVDTGHMLIKYKNGFLNHIPKTLPKLTTYMHLHDNHMEKDEHLGLGKGNADQEEILDLINILKPKTIIAETNTLEDALETIKILKENL